MIVKINGVLMIPEKVCSENGNCVNLDSNVNDVINYSIDTIHSNWKHITNVSHDVVVNGT